MIIQELVEYYERLLDGGVEGIARFGWSTCRVRYVLDIDYEGNVLGLIPSEEKSGRFMVVPEQVEKTSKVVSNFMCDGLSYILGVDKGAVTERSVNCFEASKESHLSLLSGVRSPIAEAICRFYSKWDPIRAFEVDSIRSTLSDDKIGGNVVFSVCGEDALFDSSIRDSWVKGFEKSLDDSEEMVCLVTGKKAPVRKSHPSVKGVAGSKTTGAKLVSFNEAAFESYGRTKGQGLNAPVSRYAAFAYSEALGYLLSSGNHRVRIGDTTIVYWGESRDEKSSDFLSALFSGGSIKDEGARRDAERLVDDVMHRLSAGKPIPEFELDENFFVLGLTPNASRLSVRFFHRDTFGNMLRNLNKHYERISISHAPYEREYLTPYQLMAAVENPNATKPVISSQLGGSLMRSILCDLPYPEALYSNVLLRIRTSKDDEERKTLKINRGRAAIIKAYLLRNRGRSEEEVTMELNEERNDVPYVLGRAFSLLETVQEESSPGIKTTIKDRYFDTACANPSLVFPVVLKLHSHHMRKLKSDKPGLGIRYERMLEDALQLVPAFPKRLDLEEQGDFILGYYHQTRKRYEKAQVKEADEKE